MRIFLRQIVVQTKFGFIFKRTREDIGAVTLEGIMSKKARVSEDEPLGIYSIELSDKVQFVVRSYPTFLDTITKIGGTIEAIAFVILLLMIVYMRLVIEQ